jgi:hypothetical protein
MRYKRVFFLSFVMVLIGIIFLSYGANQINREESESGRIPPDFGEMLILEELGLFIIVLGISFVLYFVVIWIIHWLKNWIGM